MDALHAAELLYRHNIWRRGDDTYDMANPKELGIALDMAVVALRETDTLRARIAELEAINDDLTRKVKLFDSTVTCAQSRIAIAEKRVSELQAEIKELKNSSY